MEKRKKVAGFQLPQSIHAKFSGEISEKWASKNFLKIESLKHCCFSPLKILQQ